MTAPAQFKLQCLFVGFQRLRALRQAVQGNQENHADHEQLLNPRPRFVGTRTTFTCFRRPALTHVLLECLSACGDAPIAVLQSLIARPHGP